MTELSAQARDRPGTHDPHDAFPHTATLRVRATSHERAEALRRALEVEADDPLGGAEVRLEAGPRDEPLFTIHIAAVDPVHLRAATNSLLKWLKAADASIDAASGTQ